ncbi:DNA binding protein [Rhodococcus phage Trina]|uniref:Helix-turn-helix DNA binding domain protein n=1 Tax=Rhodococcus phage Trina TaxID=2027905 RepID=A0A2D1ADM1_9CAUD|nr:DNA binding protein [Rhodococcus phage Trina]ASZ74924.1 hypothetical protein SEA_TRINA_110 [Rhodococcus phage Trina]
MPKVYDSKAWLQLEFVTRRKTVEQIAKEQGVAKNTIRERLKKFGLIR